MGGEMMDESEVLDEEKLRSFLGSNPEFVKGLKDYFEDGSTPGVSRQFNIDGYPGVFDLFVEESEGVDRFSNVVLRHFPDGDMGEESTNLSTGIRLNLNDGTVLEK